jgi:cysteine-rich repeat protein
MRFDGAGVLVGPSAPPIGPMGSAEGSESSDVLCPGGSVAAALLGSAGAALDRIGLRCDIPAHTLCGDGLLGGAEVCDDGDAVPDDGCNALCVPD